MRRLASKRIVLVKWLFACVIFSHSSRSTGQKTDKSWSCKFQVGKVLRSRPQHASAIGVITHHANGEK